MKRPLFGSALLWACLLHAGCSTPPNPGTDGPPPGPDGGADLSSPPGTLLRRESRSSAIAISDDDRVVAAVSPDDDRVYLINTTTGNSTVFVQLAPGAEPRSIAYAPDGSFWVANRGDGTIVRIGQVDQPSPTLGSPIHVGAEPTGIALSPAGTKVVVANYADGTLSLVDTRTRAVTAVVVGQNPRAVAVTNGGSGNDAAETALVTLMFGQPVGGDAPSEGNDTGRQGIVIPIALGTGIAAAPIKLAPLSDTTFAVPDKALPPNMVKVGAYPNQLQAIAINNGKVYVPSTAASPAGPVNFAGNVHPLVSVFDQQGTERLFGPSGQNATTACGTSIANKTPGYAAGTVDLAIQVRDLGAGLLFPTIPVDIAFVPRKTLDVGYVLSMASDVVTRVVWDYAGNTACAGAQNAKQINLQEAPGAIKAPIGIVVSNDESKAYVNAWVGREVQVITLSSQSVSARVPLSPQPQGDGALVQKGKKFFWTSTGRWSNKGWGACGACHPDGLSDNVTFVFNTGPRNTLSLDADFAKKGDGTPDLTDQRILNWSAIFDEVHDFENNTRGVSGGLGAVVSTGGVQIDLAATGDGNLNGSVKQLAADNATLRALVGGGTDKVDSAVGSGWDAIERYVASLRSLHRSSRVDPGSVSVQNGAKVFGSGQCAQCHDGPKWTVSRRFYAPIQGTLAGGATCSLQTTPLKKKSVPTGGNQPQNTDTFQLQSERPGNKACTLDIDCGGIPGITCTNNFCTVQPQRLTCAVRNVGTFGAGSQGAAFEVRSDTNALGKSLQAEGATGFNPPSLLSLAATAPYLHNGAAQSLPDLFTNAAFRGHATAGNPNFAPTPAEVQDLVNFLLSIDATTQAPAIDPNFDLCTGSFVANNLACTKP